MRKTKLKEITMLELELKKKKSAEGQDDSVMSLFIKNLCALLTYNQPVEHTCMN